MGGVSIWCEQLIRGIPDYRWEVVALTVDGTEKPVFALPGNLDRVHSVPLWGDGRAGRRPARPGAAFTEPYEIFLRELVTPLPTTPEQAAAGRRMFLHALRGLHEYASAGGDLGSAVLSNDALGMMLNAWDEIRVEEAAPAPTVADAVRAS